MTDESSDRGSSSPLAMTLWSGAGGSERFLIPDDLELPAGEYLLRTATGRERRVDPAALAPYGVSAEEAQAWAKEQLGEVARRLGSGLRESLFGVRDGGERRDAGSEDTRGTGEGRATPGMDLLADITDTPREKLSGDYRALGQALRGYFADLAQTTGQALSGDPERERAARERVDVWAKTLRDHGIGVPDGAEPGEDPGKGRAPDPGAEPRPDGDDSRAEEPGRSPRAEDLRRLAQRLGTGRESSPSGPDAAKTAEALDAFAEGVEAVAGRAASSLRGLATEVRESVPETPDESPGEGTPAEGDGRRSP